jgi:hypothetical protein|eukprot:COSAG06_NODE_1376_length_9648_cov_67.818096_10_plen_179_part_00
MIPRLPEEDEGEFYRLLPEGVYDGAENTLGASHFYIKNDHFTKTGSGQTHRKVPGIKKKAFFFCRLGWRGRSDRGEAGARRPGRQPPVPARLHPGRDPARCRQHADAPGGGGGAHQGGDGAQQHLRQPVVPHHGEGDPARLPGLGLPRLGAFFPISLSFFYLYPLPFGSVLSFSVRFC